MFLPPENRTIERHLSATIVGVRDRQATPRGLLNDFTRGLGQQMFFWGRDVLEDGNLLLCHGFEKARSRGLQGTSCYRKHWNDGRLELHGACAGWYPLSRSESGFLFIRADRRCYVHGEPEPVIPGRYDYSRLDSQDLDRVMPAARTFAAWLLEYESWIATRGRPAHRTDCFRLFSRLPASRPWLRPSAAMRWFAAFAEDDPSLTRSRCWQ